ncbi:hypothetical protein AURDEDRAFT_168021 [Auricularia subglabra TFB-10046 SS5]|nr:hypothetical protein AURDEDRAFT_168021 [Auricularia subglabra TFB-10046 SS5]
MKKRHPRKLAPQSAPHVGSNGLSRLPIELHRAWLHYLSQPDLLRVGAVSQSLRALVLDEPRFYLAVHLQTIRGHHHQRFIQQLNNASRQKLPIGILLDFPYVPIKYSCDILATKVSPVIKRAMPYVRKLSVVSSVALPASAVDFLQAPAPQLHEFIYRIVNREYDPGEDDYDDSGGSNSDDYCLDDWEPTAVTSPPPLRVNLFNRIAPKLSTVRLCGIPLPDQPIPAFGGVTRASLSGLHPVPSVGFGAHFPAAKHMDLMVEDECFVGDSTCARSAWLPSGLLSLDVHFSAPILQKLMRLANPAAVPHIRVAFEWQYDSEYNGRYSPVAQARRDRVTVRDAAWAACLAPLAAPRGLDISCTSYASDGQPLNLRVVVSGRERSVTFYGDLFFHQSRDGEPHSPLASLESITADLCAISVCHAHLEAVFRISYGLPALRELRVTLTLRTRAPFWDDGADDDKRFVECPALERLVLCCDSLSGAVVASDELSAFARSLSISVVHRPRLILHGVRVERGTGHAAFFETWK